MAQDQLNYKITADTKGFVNGVNQATKATSRSTVGTRRNSQAFTQLAYALDDAQYGIRGVQNNLQQIAVTAGLSGGAVFLLTAALVAISQYFSKPQNVKKFFNIFRSNVNAAKADTEELVKTVKKLQDIELTQDQKIIINNQNLENKAKSELVAINKELSKGEEEYSIVSMRGLNQRVRLNKGITDIERKSLEVRKKAVKDIISFAQIDKQSAIDRVFAYDEQIRKEKELAAQKKISNNYSKSIKGKDLFGGVDFNIGTGFNTFLGVVDTATNQIKEFGFVGSSAFKSITGEQGKFSEGFSKWTNVAPPKIKKVKTALEELAENFRALQEKFSEFRYKFSDDFKSITDVAWNYGTSIGNAIQSAFEALGSGGNPLEALASSILNTLGDLLIKMGAAAIAAAALSTTFATPVGFAAGAAALALGGLLKGIASSVQSSGFSRGGSGSTSSSNLYGANGQLGVQSQSDSANNSGMVAVAKVQGQDLILALQNANYSRAGYNPA